MKAQDLIKENELYLVDGSEVNKYTFTTSAGQSTFEIPFSFDSSSMLTLYYNGVMMKENDNYTISGNTITLVDWTTGAGDYIVVMGVEGTTPPDFTAKAEEYLSQIDIKETTSTEELNNKVSSCTNELNNTYNTDTQAINTLVNNGKTQLNNLINSLPENWQNRTFKNQSNTFTADGKITMANTYAPINDQDVATKKYLDGKSYQVGDVITTARTDLGDNWILCNGDFIAPENYPNLCQLLPSIDYNLETAYDTITKSNNLCISDYFDGYFLGWNDTTCYYTDTFGDLPSANTITFNRVPTSNFAKFNNTYYYLYYATSSSSSTTYLYPYTTDNFFTGTWTRGTKLTTDKSARKLLVYNNNLYQYYAYPATGFTGNIATEQEFKVVAAYLFVYNNELYASSFDNDYSTNRSSPTAVSIWKLDNSTNTFSKITSISISFGITNLYANRITSQFFEAKNGKFYVVYWDSPNIVLTYTSNGTTWETQSITTTSKYMVNWDNYLVITASSTKKDACCLLPITKNGSIDINNKAIIPNLSTKSPPSVYQDQLRINTDNSTAMVPKSPNLKTLPNITDDKSYNYIKAK